MTTVIPTYNRPELLMDRAIASVYRQTVSDWELVVVGDGTDAETVRLMTDLAAQDSRVRFWNLKRPRYPKDPRQRWRIAGLRAINFGLDHATHDWVSILPDDDEYRLNHHADLVAYSRGVDVVYGLAIIRPRGQVCGTRWPPEPLDITQGSYIIRRSVTPRIQPADCVDGAWDGYWWRAIIASGARFRQFDRAVHTLHDSPGHATYHDDYR